MEELKKCPFCGGEIKLQIVDDEGNFQDEEYEKDPWSGLGYMYTHNYIDNPKCPIAKYAGEIIGIHIYDTREEAIEAWNRRVEE